MSIPTTLGPEIPVPHQGTAAAAPEIDHDVPRLRAQELPQHVVADLRAEERRRHALVARVGVQGFVEVLRLFGELLGRTQIEVVVARGPIRPAASLTDDRV